MTKFKKVFFTPYTVLVLGVIASIFSSVILVRAQQSYITEYILVSYGGASINAYGSATGLHVIQGDNIFGESLTLGTSDITNSALKWPQNVYGGSGDQAGISYTRQGTSGENTILKIANYNDAGDGISFDAGYISIYGSYIGLNDNLQIQQDTMSHLEEHKSGSITNYYNYGWCNEGSGPIQSLNDQENNTRQKLVDLFNNTFRINTAKALPQCIESLEHCQYLGCEGCIYNTANCPDTSSWPWQCSDITCQNPEWTNAGNCDFRDTEITVVNSSCCGNSYVYRRECQHVETGTATDYYTKLEFVGSGSGTAPNTRVPSTILHDNIIVSQNEWGDGDDSSATNCGWLTGNSCADGEFMAGYNDTNDDIYCCKL